MNVRREADRLPSLFDRVVEQAVGIDRFCSSSTWVEPARDAFHPETELLSWVRDDAAVAFAAGTMENVGRVLTPLEGVWGLASPVAAHDPQAGAALLIDAMRECEWRVALVCGLEPASPLMTAIRVAFRARRFRVRPATPVRRMQASLAGGWDGYLSRRTRKFRANIRRNEARCADAGYRFEIVWARTAAEIDPLYERVLAIERNSWKTRDGNGVAEGPMRPFNLGVLRRGAERDRALFVFATRGEQDAGYLHGVVVDGYFRGLQMSFDDAYREDGVGSAMQRVAIRALCEAGATTYDLGSELPYKLKWAEQGVSTTGLLALR